MNTADVITAFLNNELSPEQEREFLLSVAASDAQRLALKSHVMLDRVLAGQMQRATVPDTVRTTIFAAAAASFAEPLPGHQAPREPVTSQPGIVARLRSLVSQVAAPAVATLLTLLGFGAGYHIGSEQTLPQDQVATVGLSQNNDPQHNSTTAVPLVKAPVQAPTIEAPAPATAMPDQQKKTPREVVRRTASAVAATHRTQPSHPSTAQATEASAISLPQPQLPTWVEGGNVFSPLHVDVKQAQRSEQEGDLPSSTILIKPTIRKPNDTSAQNPRQR